MVIGQYRRIVSVVLDKFSREYKIRINYENENKCLIRSYLRLGTTIINGHFADILSTS